ncbi:MAG TPA: lytic transglycosylase domain-containing protein [Streptosporangiaceae bacterium]|nr:lytic transglycosylase domain-containing protein [Streptosporangiaceae bacterium]
MRSPLRRKAPRSTAIVTPALRGVAVSGLVIVLAAGHSPARPGLVPEPSGHRPGAASATTSGAHAAAAFRQIILPDLLVVDPAGLTPANVARIRKITGVRNVIAFDGGEIRAGRRPVSVIGVNPDQFRSWTPLRTASDQGFWTALSRGRFAASESAKVRLGLRRGASYQLAGASSRTVRFGRAARLGVAGVDLVVNDQTSRALGLVHSVAALISAPGAGLTAVTSAVRAVLGVKARIVSMRSEQLPVSRWVSGRLPGSYLALFRQSAAMECPGMSWTILAAIGQIESADGTNAGPSSAGALGPMQFLPSTWKVWGISGFGRSGPPDIMNPYDAVPSAARMLCADGAAGRGHALYQAIFDYNHAAWYVSEVLGLASEYARDYR